MNATATPNVKMPPVLTAAEFVKGLPAGFREALLCELVEELVRQNGSKCLIPITSLEGADIGHFVPAEAAAELFKQHGPKLTGEQEAEIDRRLERLQEAIPVEQAIATLRASAGVPQKQPA